MLCESLASRQSAARPAGRLTTAARVLVTGVGGAPGLDLARSLLRLGCEVIVTDANPLASGLRLPGVVPRIVPAANDPTYERELLDLCRRLAPHAVMSCVEHELVRLLAMGHALAEVGVRVWLPDRPAIEACADKASFHQVLTAHEIPTPASWLPDDLDQIPAGRPLVVKPRRGQGAKNVIFCSTIEQAKVLCQLMLDPIVQEHIEGQEFTADCLVDRSGRASAILRYRLVVKGGLAVVAETFHNSAVAEQVTHALAVVGVVGPCCVQGFLTDNSTDNSAIVLTEINARVGGGFPLAEAAGAHYVEQALNGLLERPIDHGRLTYRTGVCLTKYHETLDISERCLP